MSRRCSSCKQEKDESEFDGDNQKCNDCRQKEIQEEVRLLRSLSGTLSKSEEAGLELGMDAIERSRNEKSLEDDPLKIV